MTIAIIGHTGVVGNAVYKYYQGQKDVKLMGLSLESKTATYEEINNKADYIFVCVPTPFRFRKTDKVSPRKQGESGKRGQKDRKQSGQKGKEEKIDISAVVDVLSHLEVGKKVIIKSTVPPGTVSKLQEDFPHLLLFFNPEFLSAKKAESEFANPDRQLVGFTDVSFKHSMEILSLLPLAPYEKIMTSTEAEIAKYVNNFHGAMMIIFANFFFDVCEKTGADFDIVKEACLASKFVGSSMGRTYWNVNQGGYRGYGGMCFPKDMQVFLEWCKTNKIPTRELLATVVKLNQELLALQNLSEEEVSKL